MYDVRFKMYDLKCNIYKFVNSKIKNRKLTIVNRKSKHGYINSNTSV